MNGKTHAAIGVAVGVASAILLPPIVNINKVSVIPTLSIPAMALGALLSDIDIVGSPIGRKFPLVAENLKHRGPTHTFGALMLVMLVGYIMTIINNPISKVIALVVVMMYTTSAYNKVAKYMRWRKLKLIQELITYVVITIVILLSEELIDEAVVSTLIATIFFGIVIGYFTHLIADSLNPTGEPLFMPISVRRIRLLGIRTGSYEESTFFMIFMILIIVHIVTAKGGLLYV